MERPLVAETPERRVQARLERVLREPRGPSRGGAVDRAAVDDLQAEFAETGVLAPDQVTQLVRAGGGEMPAPADAQGVIDEHVTEQNGKRAIGVGVV